MVDARFQKLDDVLRQIPWQYQSKERLRRDVQALMKSCQTLSPGVETFRGVGKTATLFHLFGVLPIKYQGKTYNIPVTLYFDPPYPKDAPRCFVTPTSDMALKPNNPNVDSGGMVTIPYLQAWNERTSNLVELATMMESLFGMMPPVYAKPPAGAHAASSATPVAATATPVQAQPQAGEQPAFFDSKLLDGGQIGAVFNRFFGGGQSSQPAPAQGQGRAIPVAQAQAVPTVVATPVAGPQTHGPVQPTLIPMSRKEELVAQATQALKDRWTFVLEPLVSEANEQMSLKTQLQTDATKVREDIAALEAADKNRGSEEAELRDAERSLQDFVVKNGGREMDPDELRDTIDPNSRVVLDSLTEELSLDELLIALDELLAAKKITIDDFLREVRDVSRRQFMCRVQRQKAAAACRDRQAGDAKAAAPAPARIAVAA